MSVTAIPATGGAYRAAFEAAARAQRGPGWLGTARRAAFERFLELGFPTPKHEEWRHTNVAVIARGEFTPAPPPEPPRRNSWPVRRSPRSAARGWCSSTAATPPAFRRRARWARACAPAAWAPPWPPATRSAKP